MSDQSIIELETNLCQIDRHPRSYTRSFYAMEVKLIFTSILNFIANTTLFETILCVDSKEKMLKGKSVGRVPIYSQI
jgi:hypothetical protein